MGQHGHNEEFVAFVAGSSSRLMLVATALSGDPSRAQDLVQDALIATYRKWSKVRDGAPFAYARAALVNGYRSDRRRRLWRELPLPDGYDRPAGPADDYSINRDALLAALKRLTPRERAIVVLRYLEDLSERETADALGIAVGTVKSACARALKKLSLDPAVAGLYERETT